MTITKLMYLIIPTTYYTLWELYMVLVLFEKICCRVAIKMKKTSSNKLQIDKIYFFYIRAYFKKAQRVLLFDPTYNFDSDYN